jgi:hypothetical protein
MYTPMQEGDIFAKIPVFYGISSQATIRLTRGHRLIISNDHDDHITKISRYRTMMESPIKKTDQAGFIFYLTSTFQNPISKIVDSEIDIPRGNRIKILLDSIYYIIFRAPY